MRMRVEGLEDTVQKLQESEQAAYDDIEEMKTQQKERRNQFKEEIDRVFHNNQGLSEKWDIAREEGEKLKTTRQKYHAVINEKGTLLRARKA